MNGFIRLPADWQSMLGVAVIAIVAIAIAKRVPILQRVVG